MKSKIVSCTSHRKTTFSRGMGAAWPICLGYLPIGLAFGVLAQKAGLSPLEIGLMSFLVFALLTKSLGGTVIVGMLLFGFAQKYL